MTNPADDQLCREAFEREAEKLDLNLHHDSGGYEDEFTQDAWALWHVAWHENTRPHDAEAVAWQYREAGKPWRTVSKSTFEKYREGSRYEWRELFIHSPRAQEAGEAEHG